MRFFKKHARHVGRDVTFPNRIVPAGADGFGFLVGAPVVADIDDRDVAPSGDRDQQCAKFCILTFEDPAQLQPEVWPEDGQYVGVEAGDLRGHAVQYTSACGGGGENYFFGRFYWGFGGIGGG